MTKEVMVTVHGTQTGEMQKDESSFAVPGSYYEKDGQRIVLYEEIIEGIEVPVKNRLVFSEKSVLLKKSGAVRWDMEFVLQEKKVTEYHTPYGPITMGIFTKDILKFETEDKIRLIVRYDLEMQGEHQADCEVNITISAK